MVEPESSGLMNNDSCKSSATNSLDTPLEHECPRARKLINELEKPFPGPLDFDPFPHITKHLLIDLASEVAKCHISVTRAQKVYEKIQSRCEASLFRYGGIPGTASWSTDVEKKLQFISYFLQGTGILLNCMNNAENKMYQQEFYQPFPCE